ncbi:hypothetical protein wcw_1537 [Waddlia chondrophila WSU 86-1044]|uniref:Uncharacterized protein n=1 Tax=Waddlia chondrophila (strain ATCC VR-1470 / WSU 86-1044) TaxID=716544 RepID=D6YS41_WADCW|nr:hypothetical protein wcw_1537 [Waddlia chondrophila WSU 86-1044]
MIIDEFKISDFSSHLLLIHCTPPKCFHLVCKKDAIRMVKKTPSSSAILAAPEGSFTGIECFSDYQSIQRI